MDWNAPVPADKLDGIAWARILGTIGGILAVAAGIGCIGYGMVLVALIFLLPVGLMLMTIGAGLVILGLVLIGVPWLPWRNHASA